MRSAWVVMTALVLATPSRAQSPDVDVASTLLRWEVGAKEIATQMFAWAEALPHASPDLSILTTEPVVETESSGFGWRDDPFRHTPRFHSGTDFRGDPGTPILAAGDGVVKFAGRYGGYGNCIQIDHGGGVVTLYGHLRKIETTEGTPVVAGTRIGQMGSTGRATGSHLHFEVRLEGRPVDPVLAMTVAEIWRDSESAGRLAAMALAPELQKHATSAEDAPTSRPERHGRAKRTQALW
jgi:murein DD-endopeptidase MepM/ murein hydrolase activator NlpD